MTRIALLALVLLSAPILAEDTAGFYQQDDVRIFQRAELGEAVAVTAFGIRSDTRCTDPVLCFRENRLLVAAVVDHRGREREILLELGKPLLFDDGTLTLVSTSTPPSDEGAIPLRRYRLDLRWQPD